MADGITQEQFDELRRDVQEAKWLVHSVITILSGKAKADHAADVIEKYVDEGWWRRRRGTPIEYGAGNGTAYVRLWEADILTLEEAAAKGRREVAASKGVGRVTMGHLDRALSEHGLSWAVA